MKRRLLFVVLKVVVGAALIGYVIHEIAPNWGKSKQIIAALFRHRSYLFVGGTFCFALVVLLGTCRWRLLLRAHQVRLAFHEVLKLFFIGHFFSQFMPGGLAGGDIIKSFYVTTHTAERKHEAVTTIFIDRIAGIFGLFVVLLIAIVVNLGSYGQGRYVLFAVIFFGATALILLLFFNKTLMKKIPKLTKLFERIPYREFIARVYNAFNYYKDHKLVILTALLMSTAVHLILATMVYLVAHGLGMQTAFTRYLILVSLVNFAGSVPISPLGTVGILDGAYIYFFQSEAAEGSGIPGALALLIRLVYAFWGLVGLVVWLFIRAQFRPESADHPNGLEPEKTMSK